MHVFLIVELEWNGLVWELDDLFDSFIACASLTVIVTVYFGSKVSEAFLAEVHAMLMIVDVSHESVEVADESIVAIPKEEVDFTIELGFAQVHSVPSTTDVIVESIDID